MAAPANKEEARHQEVRNDDTAHPNRYLHGARLAVATLGFGLALFLPIIEASIISTSLVTISKDIDGYEQSSWVITAYLLTYTGFLLLWSKLTETAGLRPTFFCSALLFVGFSAGCGAARSITQLIVFRALQGIGGAGLYSVPTIGLFQLVPGSKYNRMNSISGVILAIGLFVGPLIGGAISQSGNWRWIFYINLPAGTVAAGLVFSVLPRRFPLHCEPPHETTPTNFLSLVITFLENADAFGSVLILSASILLVAALEEGGIHFSWDSPPIISFLVLSGFCAIVFSWWEWHAGRATSNKQPMFPPSFFTNRVLLGVLLGCFISGVPLIVAVIELPQRYQLVNGASPIEAGVRLLAYAATLPFGIILSSAMANKLRIPFVYTLLAGASLQTIGFALLSTVPTTFETWPGQYGYSVISGLGIGLSIGTFVVMCPIMADKNYQHLALGATLQSRLLGSAVGIAIVNNILSDYVRRHLASMLSPTQVQDILQSADHINLYHLEQQTGIRAVYGDAFNLQMRATIAFCAAQFLVIPLIWKKRQLRLSKYGTLE